MKEDLRKKIGGRLRETRIKLGFTQEDLAERSDLHPSFIGQIERGTKTASIFTLEKLAQALNLSLSSLFDFGSKSASNKHDFFSHEISQLLKETNPQNKELVYNMARLIVKKKK